MRCQLAHLLLILLALLLPLAPLAAQVVVVNPSVLERELDVKKVAAILQGGTTNWDDGQSVVLVLADDPAADRHLSQVIRRDRQMLLRAWKRLVFLAWEQCPRVRAVPLKP